MTLEEAIKHCEEVAKESDDAAKEFYRVSKLETHPDRKYAEGVYVECKECADEHRQLAEWLKELKGRREKDVPDTNVGDMISMQKVIDLWDKYHQTIAVDAIAYDKALKSLPSAQKKGYTKADYITALHKEYGCSLTRAEEAHQKALEYLRNASMMKG